MANSLERIGAEALLSVDQIAPLSRDARAVFAYIHEAMTSRKTRNTHLHDGTVSRRARVTLQRLDAARAELVRAGLIEVQLTPPTTLAEAGAHYGLVS